MRNFDRTGLALMMLLAFSLPLWAQGPPYPYTVANSWKVSTTPPALVAGQNVYRMPFTTVCGNLTLLTTPSLANTATNYTDNVSPAFDGQTLCYGVTAVGTNSKESALDIFEPVAIPPAPPTGLTGTVARLNGQEEIKFAWKQSPTPGITSDSIFCKRELAQNWNLWFQSSRPRTLWNRAGVRAGTVYCIATAAIVIPRPSGPSNQATIIVP